MTTGRELGIASDWSLGGRLLGATICLAVAALLKGAAIWAASSDQWGGIRYDPTGPSLIWVPSTALAALSVMAMIDIVRPPGVRRPLAILIYFVATSATYLIVWWMVLAQLVPWAVERTPSEQAAITSALFGFAAVSVGLAVVALGVGLGVTARREASAP